MLATTTGRDGYVIAAAEIGRGPFHTKRPKRYWIRMALRSDHRWIKALMFSGPLSKRITADLPRHAMIWVEQAIE